MRLFTTITVKSAALLTMIVIVVSSCSSGKTAYKHGDYYNAVLTAVQRLRSSPDHKKSKEVLSLSYQAAVDFLESDAQNQIASNANFKYKSVVGNYEKINQLYNEIRTSPGALKVIPNPVNRFKELTDYKAKAAEESYEAGIQALMKNNRLESKNAYFLFNDANTFSPGYRECIEMIEQARNNATINVIVEPALDNRYSWNFEPIVFGYNNNMFVKFYTPQQAEQSGLKRVDQFLKVSVISYNETSPTLARRTENRVDSVKSGEKTVNGQKIPVYQKISSSATIIEKKVSANGSINLWITDAASKADLSRQQINGGTVWSDTWATFSGDSRALSATNQKLVQKKEPYVDNGYLINGTKADLDDKLARAIAAYYNQF